MMIKKIPFYAKLAYLLISIISLVYIAIVGQTIIAPIVFAFLFAFLLLPFADFLENKCQLSRTLSSFVAILTLVIAIFTILILLGSQMSDLAQDWPAFKLQLMGVVTNFQNWISDTFHINAKEQLDYISSSATRAFSTGTTLIGHTILSISSVLLFLVLIFLYSFFILLHRRLLLRFVVAVFPEKHSVTVYEVVRQIQFIVKRYIFGIFLQMAIVTIVACVSFSIIGIKYAFLLGLITGIFNVIPYIGIFTALLIAVLITFATMGLSQVLLVILIMVSIHLIDGNFIMPKIVGSKVKINTLIALLGLVIGEMVWGITGMILSIPVIAIFKVIFDRIEDLKPWGMLLGEDDSEPERKPAIKEVKEDEINLEKGNDI